jgi:hypothetical protein
MIWSLVEKEIRKNATAIMALQAKRLLVLLPQMTGITRFRAKQHRNIVSNLDHYFALIVGL